VLILH